MTATHRHVPRARPGAISDTQLDGLRRLSRHALEGRLSDAEAEYLCASIAPLLDELAERRRIDGWLASVFAQDTVVPIRPEAG